MKDDNKVDEASNGFGSLLFWVIFGLTVWVVYTHGLTTDQFIEVLRVLTWPIVVVIALQNDKVWALINSFTDLEIPGIAKASRKAQQKPEALEEIDSDDNSNNQEEEFKELDTFLAQNTKNALLWFGNQKEPVTQDAFMQAYALTQPVEGDVGREKLVIFGVLLHRKLIELLKNGNVEVGKKGAAYLKHIGFLS